MVNTSGTLIVNDPLVALTRIVCGSVGACGLLPPQPTSDPTETSARARTHNEARIVRTFLRTRHSSPKNTGKSRRPAMPPDSGAIAACAAPYEMVSELDAVPPALIVGCAGLKLQVIPTGRPVQLTAPQSKFVDSIRHTLDTTFAQQALRLDLRQPINLEPAPPCVPMLCPIGQVNALRRIRAYEAVAMCTKVGTFKTTERPCKHDRHQQASHSKHEHIQEAAKVKRAKVTVGGVKLLSAMLLPTTVAA